MNLLTLNSIANRLGNDGNSMDDLLRLYHQFFNLIFRYSIRNDRME